MILLIITTTTAATIYALYALVRFHVRALAHSRKIAANNMLAVKLLADEIQTAQYARDYYRAALTEIIDTSRPDDHAAAIARRFLAMDEA